MKLVKLNHFYCKTCSLTTGLDMIDVVHKMCSLYSCLKIACYGFPFNTAIMCNNHKKEGMVINPMKRCDVSTCNNIAIYGISSTNAIHCEKHKDKEEINIVNRTCQLCGNIDIIINGACVNFCSMVEISKTFKKYSKHKELKVLRYLEKYFQKPIEFQNRVSYACAGKHAEFKEIGYDFISHKVYIEVDENQHRYYCQLGEFNRMINIYMNEGGIPIVFIRYNPDSYKDNDSKTTISPLKKQNVLLRWVKYYKMVNHIKFNLAVHYLFYDDYDADFDKQYEINPYDQESLTELICPTCKKEFYLTEMFNDHILIH